MKNQQQNTHNPFTLRNEKMSVVSNRNHAKSKRTKSVKAIALIQLAGWMLYFAINALSFLKTQLPLPFAQTSIFSNIGSALSNEFSQLPFIWLT